LQPKTSNNCPWKWKLTRIKCWPFRRF
jgi:hypothetical protein